MVRGTLGMTIQYLEMIISDSLSITEVPDIATNNNSSWKKETLPLPPPQTYFPPPPPSPPTPAIHIKPL